MHRAHRRGTYRWLSIFLSLPAAVLCSYQIFSQVIYCFVPLSHSIFVDSQAQALPSNFRCPHLHLRCDASSCAPQGPIFAHTPAFSVRHMNNTSFVVQTSPCMSLCLALELHQNIHMHTCVRVHENLCVYQFLQKCNGSSSAQSGK